MKDIDIKFKIEEIFTEQRPLTAAERELYDIYQMSIPNHVQNEIKTFWEIQGFQHKLYDGDTGIFHRKELRDVNSQEELAILYRIKQKREKITNQSLELKFSWKRFDGTTVEEFMKNEHATTILMGKGKRIIAAVSEEEKPKK
jgi:hypothetical protein